MEEVGDALPLMPNLEEGGSDSSSGTSEEAAQLEEDEQVEEEEQDDAFVGMWNYLFIYACNKFKK